MAGISELARQEEWAREPEPTVQSAAPMARATQIILAGGIVPPSLLTEVVEEGGAAALSSLQRLAVTHRRG